jgi:hypothetical protein
MISVRCLHADRIVQLNDGDRIAEGGEGLIYSLMAEPTEVAKIYKNPGKRSQAKLAAMLRNPPRDDGRRGHVAIAWPTDILLDRGSGQFRGFVMKRIPQAKPLCSFIKPAERKQIHPGLGHRHAHAIAANLASVFEALHAAGYIVGDVNDLNVLATSDGLVSIVDTDSFQVRDSDSGETFRCPVGKPQFTPPEMQGRAPSGVDLPQSHDLFGLAVLLFQLLMDGSHPFDGIGKDEKAGQQRVEDRIAARLSFPFGTKGSPLMKPPLAPPLSSLDPSLQQMFSTCFEAGMHDPTQRPSARDWRRAINAARERLRGCGRRNTHAYGNHLSVCPYCALDDEIAAALKPASRQVQPVQQTAMPPSPPAADPAPVSVAAPASTGGLMDALVRVGIGLFEQWLAGGAGQGTGPARPQPQGVMVLPGRWRLTPHPQSRQVPGLGLLMPVDLVLWANGGLQGEMHLRAAGMQDVGYALQGRWGYDLGGQVLLLEVRGDMMPAYFSHFGPRLPAPPQFMRQLHLRLSHGVNGAFEAANLNDGFGASLERIG